MKFGKNYKGKPRQPKRTVVRGKTMIDVADNVEKAVEENEKQRKEKVRRYRQEVSRKAQMANKRIRRLEERGVRTPALESFYRTRGKGNYFSIRGKSNTRVMQELAEVENYLDMATSSLTGARQILNETSAKFGIEMVAHDWVKNRERVNEIFRIVDKVEEYLKTADSKTVHLASTQLITSVDKYLQEYGKAMHGLEDDTDEIVKSIVDAINEMRVVDDIRSAKYDNFEYWIGSSLDKG